MKKYNYETKKYEEYSVPANWRVGLYSRDLEELTDCACCGKTMKYSDKYKSLEVTTDDGKPVAICKRCFKEEWIRQQMNITRNKFVELEENYMEIDDGER